MTQYSEDRDADTRIMAGLMTSAWLGGSSGEKIGLHSIDSTSFLIRLFIFRKATLILLGQSIFKIALFVLKVTMRYNDIFMIYLFFSILEFFLVSEILGGQMLEVKLWSIRSPNGKKHEFLETSSREDNKDRYTKKAYWILHLVIFISYFVLFIVYLCITSAKWILLVLLGAVLNLILYLKFRSIEQSKPERVESAEEKPHFASDIESEEVDRDYIKIKNEDRLIDELHCN